MRVVHDLAEVTSYLDVRHSSIRGSEATPLRTFVTIGVFDGVHRGHQQLISGMVEAAHEIGAVPVAMTFDPHPATVLSNATTLLLSSVEERIEHMAALGLEIVVVYPFTRATANTSAADFVASLVHHLRPAQMWVGPDFTLGHRCKGDASFLQHRGHEDDFTVNIVEPLVWRGDVVSSSRVRDALQSGDISEANGCLGRPYRLSGRVVRGRGVGRGVGVPTANLSLPSDRLIPRGGVYACKAHANLEEGMRAYPAAVNVGIRPTFALQDMVVEAHLLDFDADLYDRELRLDFIARLRDERAYPSHDALLAQLHKDITQARRILKDVR